MQVVETLIVEGLEEDNMLLVQVAEVLNGGGISRPLLNQTVTINVAFLQEGGKYMHIEYYNSDSAYWDVAAS